MISLVGLLSMLTGIIALLVPAIHRVELDLPDHELAAKPWRPETSEFWENSEVCPSSRRRGCRTSILQASRMGYPVYRRLGFQDYGQLNTYQSENATQPPAGEDWRP
jgi:hypothetical protein